MRETQVSIRAFRKHLRQLEREVGLSLSSETGCCGVTLAQCHLLLEVEERGSTSITELAPLLELDKSTLSRTVDGACRAGLLNRATGSTDRRQQVLSLTEEGKRKADMINSLCDDSYRRLFDFIEIEKRPLVVEAVAILAGAMRQKRKQPDSACCKE